MVNYHAYIICTCQEESLINLFNFLNSVFNKERLSLTLDQSPLFSLYLSGEPREYRSLNMDSERDSSDITQFLQFGKNTLKRTDISLIIKVGDDSATDIFAYRYLFLITNHLLRKQDKVVFDCPDAYYHKIGSYFFLQTLPWVCKVPFLHWNEKKIKKLPRVFSLSSEWLPALYLPGQNSELYEVLANPIFEDISDLKIALGTHTAQANRLNFISQDFSREPLKRQYKLYLKCYFLNWLNGMLADIPIEERLYSVSGMAQLLFSIMCKNVSKKYKLDRATAERLLDICCDFSDCILQVAENIVSHTEGGVISIRINDNWDKIKYAYNPKQKISDWYMRISLVDFSQNSILDNVKEKSGINDLTLSHIFMKEETPEEIESEVYRNTAQAYQNYLNDSQNIIHHYGLAVFRNVVNQYNGCFTIKSDTRGTFENVEQYVSESPKISFVDDKNRAHIPGSEYDILLPLDNDFFEVTCLKSNPSLLMKPNYIIPFASKKVIFEEDIYDYFNEPLSRMILEARNRYGLQYQALKEYVVEESASKLAQKIISHSNSQIENCIFYFYLSDITEQLFGRTEIAAKIIMQVIAELKKKGMQKRDNQDWLHIVLYGLSESRVALFTRQFALFYHRDEGNRLMKGCRVYIVSGNYCAEVMFAGVKLSVISDYCRSRRLVNGTSMGISNILSHIASRDETQEGLSNFNEIEAFPFELLVYRHIDL